MKRYRYNLDDRLVREAFRPVRNKEEAISTLMRCIKLMLVGDVVPAERKHGELQLDVSKTSRLYIFSEGKYVSFGIPFSVNEEGETLQFHSKSGDLIDNKITSDILGVLNTLAEDPPTEVISFAEIVCEAEVHSVNFWTIFFQLLLYEMGYVRYDHDAKNEAGDLHPLHHYDFFYTSSITCKIGLRSELAHEEMIDFLSISSFCRYIEDNS